MKNKVKILSIIGSPQKRNSNTAALVEDFVEEISLNGVDAEHQMVTLGQKKVEPCIGCWNCTRRKPCPFGSDALRELKEAMINCDLLILGSPVYTNQVSAQMKAFFDRLFTWCHIFPLLGKYSLSACSTGQEGEKPTTEFLQKMLATFGTFSLGKIESMGGFTSGFFPFRKKARIKHKKLAGKVADILGNNTLLPVSSLQKKMFKIMSRKMQGTNMFRYLVNSEDRSSVAPPKFLLKLVNKKLNKNNVSQDDINTIANMMEFEYSWWKDRNWFKAKSFQDLLNIPVPQNFNIMERLLEN